MRVGRLRQSGRFQDGERPIAREAAKREILVSGTGMGFVLILVTLALWEIAVRISATPVYLLPAPTAVFAYLVTQPVGLVQAAGVTLLEAVGGLALGASVGMGLAVLITFWERLEQGVMSLAILLKSTPIIAIAPILTIWLGFGAAPKVIVTALLTFFPVLINALSGFRATDEAIVEWLQSLDASPREVFLHARWPGARPYLFAALRVAAPLSLVGAVVAEWMGASGGLGRSMWLAYTNLNMPSLFAAVFVLTLISSAVYQGVVILEGRSRWNAQIKE